MSQNEEYEEISDITDLSHESYDDLYDDSLDEILYKRYSYNVSNSSDQMSTEAKVSTDLDRCFIYVTNQRVSYYVSVSNIT